MAHKETWINEDGLEVGFGPIVSNNLTGSAQHTKGKTKELQVNVDVDGGLFSVGDTFSLRHDNLPVGAYIQSARYISDVDFDNAVEFGTAEADGTAIDQDGLIATGTTTAEGSGALIGTVVDTVSYIAVTATTTEPTVGSGTLIVEYII